MAKTLNSREIAWKTIIEFQKNPRDPREILKNFITGQTEPQIISTAWNLSQGIIKLHKRLDHIISFYVKKSVEEQKPEITASLRLGIYQLTEMDNIPQFAAVDETVKIVKKYLSL